MLTRPPLPALCRPAAWVCLWRRLGPLSTLARKPPLLA
jgi:hypothetical protein